MLPVYTDVAFTANLIQSILRYSPPYLAVWLATHNFHSVPLLLRCALLQLVGAKKTHSVHVSAIAALGGGHEGRCNQKNLKPDRELNQNIHYNT